MVAKVKVRIFSALTELPRHKISQPRHCVLTSTHFHTNATLAIQKNSLTLREKKWGLCMQPFSKLWRILCA